MWKGAHLAFARGSKYAGCCIRTRPPDGHGGYKKYM